MKNKKTKILKITIEEWNNASRDKRELSVCRELGMDVIVLAKGTPEDRGRKEEVDGFDVIRLTTRPFGKHSPVVINRIASIFYFAHKARKIKPDIISGHDIGALFIGWLSTLLRIRKPKLVYDSHEFELGRAGVKRGRVGMWLARTQERFLMHRCSFSIMVNDIIADEVQRIHKLKDRPIVVRNVPSLWTLDEAQCINKRKELLNKMTSPRETVLLYHGGVTPDRGIETLLRVVSKNDNVCLIVLGKSDESYLFDLNSQAESLSVNNRVLFHDAVSITELWKYVGSVDLAMITIPAVSQSYYYMLPNKFFESIQGEIPVICSNYPAIAPVVAHYGIGLCCDPNSVDAINNCVEELRKNRVLYEECKNNLKKAKQELCWENERIVLCESYKQLLRDDIR